MSPPRIFPQSFARKGSLPTWWLGSAPSLPIANVASFFKAPQIFSLLFLWEPLRALLSLLCYLLFTLLPFILLSQRSLHFPLLMIIVLFLVHFRISETFTGLCFTTPHSSGQQIPWASP